LTLSKLLVAKSWSFAAIVTPRIGILWLVNAPYSLFGAATASPGYGFKLIKYWLQVFE
jgi:hypothetical protein